MKADVQKWKWYFLTVLLSFIVGILDWGTGYELSLLAFYFIPVSIAAWFLGLSGAIFLATVSAFVWFGALSFIGHTYSSAFYAFWNAIVRLVAFLMIGWSVSKTKTALDKEKETTNQLRTSIGERQKTEAALRELTATLEQKVTKRTEIAEARAQQLKNLSMELIGSEERERRRFAELLHDDLQQLLAAALMQLESNSENSPNIPGMDYARQLLRESISKTRTLSHELSPAVLQNSSLLPGLQWLVRQMNEKFGLQVQLEVDLKQQPDWSPVQDFVYRSIQELLFNIVKHAGVKSALVVVSTSENALVVTVADQGRGFNIDILESTDAKTGLGLLSVRERAQYLGGSLQIESSQGRGSRFTLTLPISSEGRPRANGRA